MVTTIYLAAVSVIGLATIVGYAFARPRPARRRKHAGITFTR